MACWGLKVAHFTRKAELQYYTCYCVWKLLWNMSADDLFTLKLGRAEVKSCFWCNHQASGHPCKHRMFSFCCTNKKILAKLIKIMDKLAITSPKASCIYCKSSGVQSSYQLLFSLHQGLYNLLKVIVEFLKCVTRDCKVMPVGEAKHLRVFPSCQCFQHH